LKKNKTGGCLFLFFFIFAMGISSDAQSQELPGEPPEVMQQQLENFTEANEDVETEDDSYLQEIYHFLQQPVNLNYADAGLLQQLKLLSPVQIQNLLSYRKLLGNFLSIYELQAIPAWDLEIINRILPYVTIVQKAQVFQSLHKRFQNGERSLLVRAQQVLEKSKGYLLNPDSVKNYYPGSPQKILLRYKYRSGNLLQYGFTAEKDAGEQFFRGAQKRGFDFYSVHFFARNLGIIKSLALGDFAVNMGQGLTQWQSLAFNKGANIINAVRQSDVLQPYNSAGEINFNRGAGITLQKKNWKTTGFISYRKLDAGFDADTLTYQDYVSSLRTSGYHRTTNETAGKGSQGAISFGGNVSYSGEKFHFGINAVHYNFDHAINKADYLYNKYALSGKHSGNYSLDYHFTHNNMYLFGEMATDEDLDKALISGLLINTDSKVSMSFLYRNISKGYQSLYGNAFTENTHPANESGFYSSITITPAEFLKIDAYADFYHFPWLKYRTDAPTSGNDYMVQLIFERNKSVELSSRFQYQNKPINYNPDDLYMNPVVGRPKQGWRTQLNYKVNTTITLRSRIELDWFDKHGKEPQNGFLVFTDVIYKPFSKSFSGNIRLSYFETDDYDSRIYSFENDVLYGYSIPAFFGKGYRYYLNARYKLNKKFSLWAKFAQTIYVDQTEIGSGLDLIKGNKKSEIKLEMKYDF
jgi:DNA uptake protein ComE-like DNA-binding protein